MSKLGSMSELQERLALAERAIADAEVRINQLTQALGEIARASEGDRISASPVTVGADTVSPFCVGFYQREYDSADRPYRWTGRGNLFELRVRVNRSFEWDFSMELQQNTYVDVGRLRGYVDYMEIPLDISATAAVVRGIIPVRAFGTQAVLTFLLPNIFVPVQLNPESTDSRTLGLVFYEFRAVPSILNENQPSVATEREVSGPASSEANSGLLHKARTSLAAGLARSKRAV